MTTSEKSKQAAAQNPRGILIGLYWAALLLFLLAYWIGTKHWDAGAMFITLGVGVLSLGVLAFAICLTGVSLRGGDLAGVKPLLGLICVMVAAALAGLLLWLVLLQKLAAFPEVSSGAVLVLIGVGAGLALLSQTGKALNSQSILDSLKNNHKILSVVLLAIGLALFCGGIVLFVVNRQEPSGFAGIFPRAGGAVLLGLVFLGGGIWQLLASPSEVTKANMRMLILIDGGAAGFVVLFSTVLYAIINRDQVFTGGISTWQEEGAWRFWLCVWLALFGLVLMFVSLLLGHGDIRKNAVVRRLLYGYNAVFTGLLLLAVLVVANILVYATFPYNYNWTESQGFYSLSNKSKNILTSLKERVTVYVIMSEGSRNFMDVRNLMENFQAYSGKVQIKFVSPDLDDMSYQRLKKLYPKLEETKGFHGSGGGRGLLVVYGPEDVKKPEHSFIAESDLSTRPAPRSPMQKNDEATPPEEFKGEALIMTQLTFLSKAGKKPIVYFTQSNGELNLDIDAARVAQGGGMLKKALTDANYEVRKLLWNSPPKDADPGDKSIGYSKKKFDDLHHQVPDEAKVVVIAWPTLPFPDDVLQALDDFMNRGGKMIVMSNMCDPSLRVARTNIEKFVKKYGVEMKQNYFFNVSGGELGEWAIARMSRNSASPLAREFEKDAFVLFMGRSVESAAGAAGGFQAESLMEVIHFPVIVTLADNNLDALQGLRALISHLKSLDRAGQLRDKQVTKAASVAVTVKDRDKKTRMVVYGAGRFASNAPLALRMVRPAPHQEVVLGSLALLEDRPEVIGIASKKSNYYRLRPKGSYFRLIFVPFGLMILFLVAMGVGIWVVRRR